MTVQIINDMNYDNLMVIYSFRAFLCRYWPPVLLQCNDNETSSSEDPEQTLPSSAMLCTSGISFAVENLSNSLTMTGKQMKISLPDLQSELTAGGNCRALVGLNPSQRAAAISENKNSYKVCSKAWYNDLIIQYHFLAANWRQGSREHCFHKDWLNLYIPMFGSQSDSFNGWLRIYVKPLGAVIAQQLQNSFPHLWCAEHIPLPPIHWKCSLHSFNNPGGLVILLWIRTQIF